MENIFVGSFVVGVGLNLLLLVVRLVGGRSGAAQAPTGFDPESDTFPVLVHAVDRSALANFLTVFGACGYLLYLYSPIPGFMVAMVAVLPAFAVAQLIHWAIRRRGANAGNEG